MRKQPADGLKRRLASLVVLTALLFGLSAVTNNAGPKPARPAATKQKARTRELRSVDQFKEAFQNDADKVRLVALISPT